MKHEPAAAIPEDRIPAILARAAELDRQSITLQALRTAAIDAGISETAIDQALQEYTTGKMVPPQPAPASHKARPRWRRWLHHAAYPFKLFALGSALGLVGAADPALAVFSVTGLIALGGYFAWRDRFAGKVARFQLAMTSLGFSTFMGMGLGGGDEDALAVVAVVGMAMLVLGTILVHLHHDDEPARKEVNAA